MDDPAAMRAAFTGLTPTDLRRRKLAESPAGQIEFRVRADHRTLEFTIESWARSGDRRSNLLYRTLKGHFEQGEMHYQVWKWLGSGDVEFRLYAFSKAADTGPWVLRTGFRLVGRINQLRFYRQTCRHVRRLTCAQLENRRAAEQT